MEQKDNEQKSFNPTDKESSAAKSGEEILNGAQQTDQLEKLNVDAQKTTDNQNSERR